MISFLQLKELYGEERAIEIASHIKISSITSSGRNLFNTNIRLWRDVRADSTSWKVPFGFDTRQSSSFVFSEEEKNIIRSNFIIMSSKIKVITFVERTTETYFIDFLKGDPDDTTCWSYLGNIRKSGGQEIQLSGWCLDQDVFEHEVSHAMGFIHEQSRGDRDLFVEILYDNIIIDAYSQFDISSNFNSLETEYDFDSTMHYGDGDFAITNGLKSLNTFGHPVRDGNGLSPGDIQEYQLIYRCIDSVRNISNFCTSDCKCQLNEGNCIDSLGCISPLVCIDKKCVDSSSIKDLQFGDVCVSAFHNSTSAPDHDDSHACANEFVCSTFFKYETSNKNNNFIRKKLCISKYPTAFPTRVPTLKPTTKAPTTSKPTLNPTTLAPTTSKPTTTAPTTSKPTLNPTTASPIITPTTSKPTTIAPTTAPTTSKPTLNPTTASPIITPTTSKPTTIVPSTDYIVNRTGAIQNQFSIRFGIIISVITIFVLSTVLYRYGNYNKKKYEMLMKNDFGF